jgi:hypothetical protein
MMGTSFNPKKSGEKRIGRSLTTLFELTVQDKTVSVLLRPSLYGYLPWEKVPAAQPAGGLFMQGENLIPGLSAHVCSSQLKTNSS